MTYYNKVLDKYYPLKTRLYFVKFPDPDDLNAVLLQIICMVLLSGGECTVNINPFPMVWPFARKISLYVVESLLKMYQ